MTHRRQEIREALVTLLTGGAVIGSNVTSMNPYDRNAAELPGVNIITGEEIIDPDEQTFGSDSIRRLRVYVDIFTTGPVASSANILDSVAEEVELAIRSDLSLGGLVMSMLYQGVEDPEINKGEQVIVYQRMNFDAVYDW